MSIGTPVYVGINPTPQPDTATIEEFTDRRNKYIAQLALLMSQYGIVVELPPPHKRAAA